MSSIGSISSASTQLHQAIGLKVLAKTNEIARSQGDAAVSLLEAATELQDEISGSSKSNIADFGTAGRLLDLTA